MKHDSFRVFLALENNLQTPAIMNFLNNGETIPRSLSLDRYYGGNVLVTIGYENNSADGPHTNKYFIIERTIKNVIAHGISGLGKQIEAEADLLDDVVCQDIRYTGDTIVVTFLTTVNEAAGQA